MTARIETAECMGQELTFIRTETGDILYKQKRNLLPATWSRLVYNRLSKSGFTREDILSLWGDVSHLYYNRTFYKPVSQVVQHFVELMA